MRAKKARIIRKVLEAKGYNLSTKLGKEIYKNAKNFISNKVENKMVNEKKIEAKTKG